MIADGDAVPAGPARSYRPGEWYAVFGRSVLVALPPSQAARVAALWELLDAGADFEETLDALISGGLRDLPAFVLVSAEQDRTRVVLRGPARADLEVGGSTVSLDGAAPGTWVEETLHDVARMSILLADESDAGDRSDEGPAFVIDAGLVRVSRIDQPPRQPAPPPEPEPEAEAAEIDTEPDVPSARSAEPPSWIPAPPVPAVPDPLSDPLPVPEDPEAAVGTDHDGETRAGSWRPPDPVLPGIPGQPAAPDVTVPVARLILPGGEIVDVDRAVVVGRAPEARRFSETEQPRLVSVASPHLEVSSTHVEIRPGSGADHGSAVVTDLGSTNGTVLIQPGLGTEELAAGVAVQLIPGAVIDLGDGVTIQVIAP